MNSQRQSASSSLRTLCVLCVSALSFFLALHASSKPPARAPQESASVRGQLREEADRKSSGCISCHTSTDEPTMHPTKTVHLGCTDCNGGNSFISIAPSAAPNSPEYNSAKEKLTSSRAIRRSKTAQRFPNAPTRSGLRNPPSTSSS